MSHSLMSPFLAGLPAASQPRPSHLLAGGVSLWGVCCCLAALRQLLLSGWLGKMYSGSYTPWGTVCTGHGGALRPGLRPKALLTAWLPLRRHRGCGGWLDRRKARCGASSTLRQPWAVLVMTRWPRAGWLVATMCWWRRRPYTVPSPATTACSKHLPEELAPVDFTFLFIFVFRRLACDAT